MKHTWLILPTILLLLGRAVPAAPVSCPAGSTAVPYHSPDPTHMVVSVTVNNFGPYEFLVDTGAQFTIMDPGLAAELGLQGQGSVEVVAVAERSTAMLVVADLVAIGPLAVRQLSVVVGDLGQVGARYRGLRGILGENYLGRFDLLIDYRQKLLCFDASRQMQSVFRGERIPIVAPAAGPSGVPFADPLLLLVRLECAGKPGKLLKLDSGTNVPVLYTTRENPHWWDQMNHARPASVVGHDVLMFAPLPVQEIKIGRSIRRFTTFVGLVQIGKPLQRSSDGLLPTCLFRQVFISYMDRFVIFDPRFAQETGKVPQTLATAR